MSNCRTAADDFVQQAESRRRVALQNSLKKIAKAKISWTAKHVSEKAALYLAGFDEKTLKSIEAEKAHFAELDRQQAQQHSATPPSYIERIKTSFSFFSNSTTTPTATDETQLGFFQKTTLSKKEIHNQKIAAIRDKYQPSSLRKK